MSERASGDPGQRDFRLGETTIAELQSAMADGPMTARFITEQYLERIEQLNLRGPELRAIIETNPEALSRADELDAERRLSGPRGPLHGIPVVLKDNIDTADAMTTTAGSLALEGSIASHDAFIVGQLRRAGAILLAKANMSEWANFRGEHSTSGWSARGGQCRNPYALDRNPCGSSSGSAVAAAANLAAVTIGTETSGSIICPSSINGVVGIKPTVGLWSRSGIIPISHTQDTAGPLCRTVTDAAVLLGSLTGVDDRDSATASSLDHALTDYTPFLEPEGLKGARIGVARNFEGFHPTVTAVFEQALTDMQHAGAVLVDPVSITMASWRDSAPLCIAEHEFKHGLNAYLAALPDAPISSLDELVAFNNEHADRELALFGQQRLIAAANRGSLDDPVYLEALTYVRTTVRDEGIDAVIGEHTLDALVAPSTDVAWPTDHIRGDRQDGGSSAGPAALAGYPNVSVPMGQVGGLPVGMSFFGRAWSEPTLIRLAFAYEQATKHRFEPTFRASVP